jgi:hypothetical protein
MEIKSAIKDWNGRSTEGLEILFETYGNEAGFSDQIIGYLADAATQTGASWLLKRYLESEGEINPSQISKIFVQLPELSDWATKLHILQSIAFIPIDYIDAERVEMFLRSNLNDKNKMVRAWAYNGFAELARQYPEYREESEALLAAALNDKSAAVRARVRNIVSAG